MPRTQIDFHRPNVVGSFGRTDLLSKALFSDASTAADIVEIRLDLIVADGFSPTSDMWSHLTSMPLLFTARRKEEGSPIELSHEEREHLLYLTLQDAAAIDIEVVSIPEMLSFINELSHLNLPWIASYHDFEKLPSISEVENAAKIAKDSGAAVFKMAAKINTPEDLLKLIEFQRNDYGLPAAMMGMGDLAPASRLLCAQYGSPLNYGFMGDIPTAPGQWSSALLKKAISQLSII